MQIDFYLDNVEFSPALTDNLWFFFYFSQLGALEGWFLVIVADWIDSASFFFFFFFCKISVSSFRLLAQL